MSVFHKNITVTPVVKNVAAIGVQEQLSTVHTFVSHLVLVARGSNLGTVYVGDANVDSATQRGEAMVTLAVAEFFNVYLDEIWLDVTTNGEGVSIRYEIERPADVS